MVLQRGGYQKPEFPAPVSGPGALSKRTDGSPSQPATYIKGLPYGQGQATFDQQVAQPMAGNPNEIRKLENVTPLFADSEYPDEDISHGASWGEGPTPLMRGGQKVVPDDPINAIFEAMQFDKTGRLETLYNRMNFG